MSEEKTYEIRFNRPDFSQAKAQLDELAARLGVKPFDATKNCAAGYFIGFGGSRYDMLELMLALIDRVDKATTKDD